MVTSARQWYSQHCRLLAFKHPVLPLSLLMLLPLLLVTSLRMGVLAAQPISSRAIFSRLIALASKLLYALCLMLRNSPAHAALVLLLQLQLQLPTFCGWLVMPLKKVARGRQHKHCLQWKMTTTARSSAIHGLLLKQCVLLLCLLAIIMLLSRRVSVRSFMAAISNLPCSLDRN